MNSYLWFSKPVIRASVNAPELTLDASELASVVLLERGYSQATQESFKRVIDGMACFQPRFADLTPADVRKRLATCTSKRSQTDRLHYIRQFFDICIEQGWWIGRNPTRRIRLESLPLADRIRQFSPRKNERRRHQSGASVLRLVGRA